MGDGPRAAGMDWAGPLRLTADEADQAKLLAMRVAAKLAPATELGFAFNQDASGLVAQLRGRSEEVQRAAFMLAPSPASVAGFEAQAHIAFAARHELGEWGATVFAQSGDIWLGGNRQIRGELIERIERDEFRTFGLAFDRQLRGADIALSLRWMAEDRTVLGGFFHEAIGGSGADTVFADFDVAGRLGAKWTIGAQWTQGLTMPRTNGILDAGSRIHSNAWSFDLVREDTLRDGDRFGLRLSQPLRVASGGLDLNLPIAFDYASERATIAPYRLNLAPSGREVIGELNWSSALFWGHAGASVFYRHEPGHFANQRADVGALVSFDAKF